jgi:hypothetical protein
MIRRGGGRAPLWKALRKWEKEDSVADCEQQTHDTHTDTTGSLHGR